MIEILIWLPVRLFGGLVDLVRVVSSPELWPDPTNMADLVYIVYYGASLEFLFVVLDVAIVVLVIGLWRHGFLWGVVRVIEGISNVTGRLAAWAALVMVLQQIVIIALQRIFLVSEISIGPFGVAFTRDLSWFGEELKLYNAMIVALCAAYTFVQGGHVRVDLVYAALRFRTRRVLDMFGSLFFVLPFTGVVWMFGWFFLWRHLITPKLSASEALASVERKAALVRWNVETVGFSPSGFDGYFLFKILLVLFAGLMFLQGVGFFYRCLLEFLEGEEASGKHLDLDPRADIGVEPPVAIERAPEERN